MKPCPVCAHVMLPYSIDELVLRCPKCGHIVQIKPKGGIAHA